MKDKQAIIAIIMLAVAIAVAISSSILFGQEKESVDEHTFITETEQEIESEAELDTDNLEETELFQELGSEGTESLTESDLDSESDTYVETETSLSTSLSTKLYKSPSQVNVTPKEFKALGVIKYNGWRFKYYSEKVLPGQRLKIPGRHSDEYFVRDKDENICVASSDLKWGSYIETPFGMGRVYDGGCKSGTIDIYVSGRWGE